MVVGVALESEQRRKQATLPPCKRRYPAVAAVEFPTKPIQASDDKAPYAASVRVIFHPVIGRNRSGKLARDTSASEQLV